MEITRKSHVADAILLEFAGTVIDYLPNDLSKFTAYDPDLNQDKADLVKSTYDNILTYGTDNIEVGIVIGLTEKLSDEFKKCISLFKDVRYFANKKFGTSPAILKEFGLGKYAKARKSQPAMIVFMHELDLTVQKYKVELKEAGLKETVIAGIKPAATALEESNSGQESGKGHRMVKTEGRILLLNNLYDLLQEFSEASRRVFENDALSRSHYVLPYNTSKEEEKDDAKKTS
jgi:hypothetical protein